MKTFQEFMFVIEGVRPGDVETPLDKAAFKKRRRSLAGREASADARSRGHEEPSTGRTYSTDEARSRRSGIHTPEKKPSRDAARDAAGGETGHGGPLRPNKVRKARAMGELRKEALETELEEGLRRKIAAAGLAAAAGLGALGAGGAKAGQWSGEVNARYGSVPAVATDSSVRSGIDKALANLGTSHSASEIKGKTGLTGGANVSYSGTAGKSNKVSDNPSSKPEPNRKTSSTRTSPSVRSNVRSAPKVVVPPGRALAFAKKQAELKKATR